MDRMMVYSLIYALAAAEGREGRLFGPYAQQGRNVFACSAPGKNFPELWFELPLSGQPRFDLHVLTSREDLGGGIPSPDLCGGYPAVFRWFAEQKNVRQLALSWDLNADDEPTAAIQLLMAQRDDPTACGFLQAAGRPDAADGYPAFLRHIPEAWYACYLGVFPSRPDLCLRVECIPDVQLQKAYAQDTALLEEHLTRAGLSCVSDSILKRCRLLASLPFQLEFQFDVERNGLAGATFGASVRFALGQETESRQSFRANGAAGELMAETEKWGLADSRWRELEGTAFAQRLRFGGESTLLFCAPVFLKLRWRNGEALDAKAYLMAGAQ